MPKVARNAVNVSPVIMQIVSRITLGLPSGDRNQLELRVRVCMISQSGNGEEDCVLQRG